MKNKKIHLIGIGGVSMSGIAYMLKDMGAFVTGSDASDSAIIQKLISDGVKITIGHNEDFVKNADIIVYTAAIKETDPELSCAVDLSKELYERAQFLGKLSKLYENCLCIAGTHGKSTTTGMVSNIFLEAKKNPTISIGANLPAINSNVFIGSKEYLIMESCEYVDSFLHFFPTSSIVTNIDNDHLDYFGNLENVKASFLKYASLIPNEGYLIMNNDDENSEILKRSSANIITYGINNDSVYSAKNITYSDSGEASYELYINNKFKEKIELSVAGVHNVYNSLAAIAMSEIYIDDFADIKNGLKKYTGVGRRFEFLGKCNEALVYDDYAHHPTEVKTTLQSVKKVKSSTNYAVFQSHTYSRTKEHLEDFAEVLSNFDNVIIAPIYAAREENIYKVKESDLVDLIKVKNKNVLYLDSFEKIEKYLKETVKKDDLVITIGAGPINEVAKNITK